MSPILENPTQLPSRTAHAIACMEVRGGRVEIDPKNFKVTNGRLILFYKSRFGNALNDWNKDEADLTVKTDASWKKVAIEK